MFHFKSFVFALVVMGFSGLSFGAETTANHQTGYQNDYKQVVTSLADAETQKILATNWLKEDKVIELEESDTGISGFFWGVTSVVVLLALIFACFFCTPLYRRAGLRLKLIAGFSTVAILLVGVASISYLYFARIVVFTDTEVLALEMERLTAKIEVAQDNFLLHGIQNKAYGEQQIALVKKDLNQARELAEKIQSSGTLSSTDEKRVLKILEDMSLYEKELTKFVDEFHLVEKDKEQLEQLSHAADAALTKLADSRSDVLIKNIKDAGLRKEAQLQALLGNAASSFLRAEVEAESFLLDKKPEHLPAIETQLNHLDQALTRIESLITSGKDKAIVQEVRKELVQYTEGVKEMVHAESIVMKEEATLKTLLHEVDALGAAISHQLGSAAHHAETEADRLLIVLAIVGSLAAFMMGVILSNSISRPIQIAIESIQNGSDQVNSAAGLVASSGEYLAQASSEQAAAIEETSSSMEEISSMTNQNNGNTKLAQNLAQETRAYVQKGNEAMVEMNTAIQAIKGSVDETDKIIKTIDEIAFQTNLLALNAAVEAARAGEAGSGFAVVAEEVRNLAQRSSEAAKNTSALILDSREKATHGVEVAVSVDQVLSGIHGSVTKLEELMQEVVSAIGEQTKGITQITDAMGMMDQTTQGTAANAEEAAAASEELSSQSEMLRKNVLDLLAVIMGMNYAAEKALVIRDSSGVHSALLENDPDYSEKLLYSA